MSHAPRLAKLEDLNELVSLENQCFDSDRISSRSFRYFLKKGQAQIWVCGAPINAYALLLFHRGTSLARIYSIAVSPEARGRGLAKALLEQLEGAAVEHGTLFIRLEVKANNYAAIKLYEQLGYKPIRHLAHYYEDGFDGIRMEKPLMAHASRQAAKEIPFYGQTTDFTCGPAALMMAMKRLNPSQALHQIEELNLWREATTIFMTTGHGGTSPAGLALAAHRRGIAAEIWVSHDEPAFLESVRNPDKREIIERIDADFQQQCQRNGIPTKLGNFSLSDLSDAMARGRQVLLIISTYRFNRKKEPHWVWIVSIDERFVYINDPNIDPNDHRAALDSVYLPVPRAQFEQAMKYGQKRFRAALLLSARTE